MELLTALIVDDEPAARRDLEQVLATIQDVRIVAQASDAAAARQMARRHRPDLIFLDIQLPGVDGFTALQQMGESRGCVIFTTAYAQFAIQAFEVGATDYLLKPVDEERCRRAVERARENLRRPEEGGPLLEIEDHGTRTRVPLRSVRLITASGNYLVVEHERGSGLMRQTLEGLLTSLEPNPFLRINRHQAVRPSAVQGLSGNHQRGLQLLLRDERELKVSRRRAAEVSACFRGSAKPRPPTT
jgi:two-component system LytT family response regulator